jgi:hypothetical protein
VPRGKHKTRKGNKLPPFVALPWDMLNSKAYRDLPHAAAKALPFFLGKVKCGGYNDPTRYETVFTFPYSEAERLGFARATFARVIRDLVGTGFIDPVDKGGMKSEGLTKSHFRLSHRWTDYGEERFQALDWRCFQPGPRSTGNSLPFSECSLSGPGKLLRR